MAVSKLGWNAPHKPLLQLHPDPRWLALGIITARELGDSVTEARLRQAAESTFEPRFFGPDGDHFGWWFRFGEQWPRGQLSSLMVLSELGTPGAWSLVFNQPNLEKFAQPTVSGVDYPAMGLSQCWNDRDRGALWVETYCATAPKRGSATRFTVSGLADPAAVRIIADGQPFDAWSPCGPDAIEIRTDIAQHRFRLVTGYARESRPQPAPTAAESVRSVSANNDATVAPNALAKASRHLAASGGCSGSCC